MRLLPRAGEAECKSRFRLRPGGVRDRALYEADRGRGRERERERDDQGREPDRDRDLVSAKVRVIPRSDEARETERPPILRGVLDRERDEYDEPVWDE